METGGGGGDEGGLPPPPIIHLNNICNLLATFLPLFCIHKFGIVVQVQVIYCVVEFIVLGVFENVMLYCMYYIVIFMYIPAFMCIATVTKMDTKIWS